MLELGNMAFARLKGDNVHSSALSKRDVIMVSFIRLVRQYFRTEHLVDFYARELGISSKHLSRIIKEVMGKTPHDVICHELIQYAMTLLKADKFSIQGIAADLHFSDQASFCKFFKKWTGMTPGEYRKKLKSKDKNTAKIAAACMKSGENHTEYVYEMFFLLFLSKQINFNTPIL